MIKSLFTSKASKSLLNRSVAYVVKILCEKDHKDIKAVYSDFPIPKKVVRESTREGFLPEVTAVKDGQYRLFAIETRETLNLEETDARWLLFAEYSRQNDGLFYIVFPTVLMTHVKQKMQNLGIEARLWQTPID